MAETADKNPNCLFLRGRDDDPETMEEMWDDTALIRAYDKAISSVQKKLNIASTSNSNSTARKTARVRKQGSAWKVGDSCQARFSEDGYFYEATIGAVDYSCGRCVVKYAHYGNEEEVNLSDVLSVNASLCEQDLSEFENSTVSSVGRLSVSETGSAPKSEKGGQKKKKKRHSGHNHAPPAPSFSRTEFLPRPNLPHRDPGPAPGPSAGFRMPPLPAHLKTNSEDPALNSMLMSWYMCGYHSGYYQGMLDGRGAGNN